MKEMIKRIREEKGGFTLAELLVVVAIVMVLVAIAVPVFTGSLDKANKAVDAANMRTVKVEASYKYLLAEADKAGSGANAVTGKYYIDANDDVVKQDAAPTDSKGGPYEVSVEGSGETAVVKVVKG